ncbi:MAG: hypothetical protein WCX71_01270 [Candidatus Buchananbacteria bacterium]
MSEEDGIEIPDMTDEVLQVYIELQVPIVFGDLNRAKASEMFPKKVIDDEHLWLAYIRSGTAKAFHKAWIQTHNDLNVWGTGEDIQRNPRELPLEEQEQALFQHYLRYCEIVGCPADAE